MTKPTKKMPQRKPHDHKNLWPKGGPSPNPAGRAKLPDWFKETGPSSLAMQVAAGTGRIVELDGDTIEETAARTDMALNARAPIRLAAAQVITDRVYGKVKETLEVDVQTVISKITRVVVRPGDVPMLAEPVDVTPVKEN